MAGLRTKKPTIPKTKVKKPKVPKAKTARVPKAPSFKL